MNSNKISKMLYELKKSILTDSVLDREVIANKIFEIEKQIESYGR